MTGIFGPYLCCETTLAMTRLASHIQATGNDVRIITSEKPCRALGLNWDEKVIFAQTAPAQAKAVHGCDNIVSFQYAPQIRKNMLLSATANRPQKHFLVLPWLDTSSGNPKGMLQDYLRVITTSSLSYNYLRSRPEIAPEKELLRKIFRVRFDAGLSPLRRKGTLVPGRVKACVFVTATVVDHWGSQLLHIIQELMETNDVLDFTLSWTKAWPEHDRRLIKFLRNKYASRFTATRRQSLTCESLFLTHDWVIFPEVSSSFGLSVSTAMCCGAGVITLNLAPYNEFIETGVSGILVPCNIRHNSVGAPVGIPFPGTMLDRCQAALQYPCELLYRIQSEQADTRRPDSFGRFWTSHLELGMIED